MYNKFGERSFQNTTSTPVKSPLNSVRIFCFLVLTYQNDFTIIKFEKKNTILLK